MKSTPNESNLSGLQYQRINWIYLCKLAICLVAFVTLLAISVLYTPVRQGSLLIRLRLLGPFKSTCSYAADRRGPNQRIVSYSLYGNFSKKEHVHKYLLPFRDTLKSIPSIYPGWIVRIYHNLKSDDTKSWETFNSHLEIGNHVDICNATEVIQNRKLGNIFAMTWRWLPMIDEMVDTIMSRDSDSRIIPREEDAVREWLASDRVFHVMRDHPWQCTSILGGIGFTSRMYSLVDIGMWGVKLSQDRPQIAGVFQKIFTMNHNHNYGYDQALLTDYIWPIAQLNMVSHDSYCCGNFPFSKPYPTPRKDGLFIGGRDVPSEALRSPCPVECRPVNATSEWNYC